jgi:hypothetical protein
MTMRQNEWPIGHYSLVTITIKESPPDGCQVKVVQNSTPQDKSTTEEIWERVFWRRLKGSVTHNYF